MPIMPNKPSMPKFKLHGFLTSSNMLTPCQSFLRALGLSGKNSKSEQTSENSCAQSCSTTSSSCSFLRGEESPKESPRTSGASSLKTGVPEGPNTETSLTKPLKRKENGVPDNGFRAPGASISTSASFLLFFKIPGGASNPVKAGPGRAVPAQRPGFGPSEIESISIGTAPFGWRLGLFLLPLTAHQAR